MAKKKLKINLSRVATGSNPHSIGAMARRAIEHQDKERAKRKAMEEGQTTDSNNRWKAGPTPEK